ncbi:MAG TPA: hypothetical protein DCS28_01810 [Candidatus Moranbacteria bacterium]|nr:hypothetical protein [Candidatus Moranbacteria bacterium]HAT74760.1 hypothetical protein [Candidatus Moranbacteria bacterium]
MNSKIKKYYLLPAIFILGLFLTPCFAIAAVDIDVNFPDPAGSIITETNILPGDFFTRTITITKFSDKANVGLMLRMDRMNSTGMHELESKILVRIQSLSNGQFVFLPGGATEKTLASLYDYLDATNNDAFQFDSISGNIGSTFQYKIWFTFDPLADNHYQGKSTVFDILLGVYSTDLNTDGGHRHSNNNTGSSSDNNSDGGDATVISQTTGASGSATGDATAGADANNMQQGEEPGITKGEQTEATDAEAGYFGWPLYIWFFCALIIFGLMSYGYYFYKLRRIS